MYFDEINKLLPTIQNVLKVDPSVAYEYAKVATSGENPWGLPGDPKTSEFWINNAAAMQNLDANKMQSGGGMFPNLGDFGNFAKGIGPFVAMAAGGYGLGNLLAGGVGTASGGLAGGELTGAGAGTVGGSMDQTLVQQLMDAGLSQSDAEAIAQLEAQKALPITGDAAIKGVDALGTPIPVGGSLDAGNILKSLVSGGASSDTIKSVLGALGQGVLQNQASNSIKSDINSMFDRLQGANPYANNPDLTKAGISSLTDPTGSDFIKSLIAQSPSFINPYKDAAATGFNTASNLVSNPNSDPGYALASTASSGLQDLYTNPMSNPILQAVSSLAAENSARRSAAGRGLQAGSMPAELQNNLMAALSSNYANIANPMNSSVSAGSNMYTGDVNAATNLGASAANANANSAQSLATLLNAGSGVTNANTSRGQAISGAQNASLNAMGSIAPTALQAIMYMDPTRSNLASLYSNAGTGAAQSSETNNEVNTAKNAATNWGLNKLWSLF